MSNNKYLDQAKVKAAFTAKMCADMVNGSYSREFGMFFWQTMRYEHRYLQNEFFWQVIMRFISEAARLQPGQYDPRNDSMVQTCKEIITRISCIASPEMNERDKKEITEQEFYIRDNSAIREILRDVDGALNGVAEHFTYNG